MFSNTEKKLKLNDDISSYLNTVSVTFLWLLQYTNALVDSHKNIIALCLAAFHEMKLWWLEGKNLSMKRQ